MSNVIRSTPMGVAGMVRRNFKGTRRAVKNGVLAAAHRGKTMIGLHTPSDLGQLADSWEVLDFNDEEIATLVNNAPHAGVVEMGARPHKVSHEGWHALYEWVERHFPEAADEDGEVDVYGNDPEFSRITWAIVRKIGRDGQRPTYFVHDKIPSFLRMTSDEVGRAMAKQARKGGKK